MLCSLPFQVIITDSLFSHIGNCLFNALSDQMYGSQNKHKDIRAAVIAELRANKNHYRPYIAISGNQRRNPKRKNVAAQSSSTFTFTEATEEEMDATFEIYMATMAKGGVYGDNIEIMAFAKAFDKDVKIYLREHSYYVRAEDDGAVRPVMHIAYHVGISSPSLRTQNLKHESPIFQRL
jgi:OTU domain-containing protein 3